MAKRDHYAVLGVPRGASVDEIRKAYRKLARQFHPDVNKSADAQKRFTEVQEAYDVLSDEQKRAAYDQYGHAAEPRSRAGASGDGRQHYTWSPGGVRGRPDVDTDELNSMFDAFFGGAGRGADFAGAAGRARAGRRAARAEPEPPESEHDLDIAFMTAIRGGVEQVRFTVGGKTKSIEVTIPKGITSGTRLRVRAGGEIGNLVFRVRIGSHPFFRRTEWPHPDVPESLDLYLDLPLNIAEAALGATVTVPTLDAPVDLTVPPGTASGRKLRLRGKGIEDVRGSRGDLYAVVRIVPPDGAKLSDGEAEALRKTVEQFPNPRAGQGWPVKQ